MKKFGLYLSEVQNSCRDSRRSAPSASATRGLHFLKLLTTRHTRPQKDASRVKRIDILSPEMGIMLPFSNIASACHGFLSSKSRWATVEDPPSPVSRRMHSGRSVSSRGRA
jgi:hypothetical protein